MTKAFRSVIVGALAACTSSGGTGTGVMRTGASPSPTAAMNPTGLTATASLHDLAGGRVGDAAFTETPGGLLITGTVRGLGLGAHGIHIHAVGKCEPPFTSAGAHFNPTNRRHGFKAEDGHHLGDLPNLFTPAAGGMTFELLLPDVSLRGRHGLLGGDGSSIVIHSSKDDYLTDPAGNSGGRIACGVIKGS